MPTILDHTGKPIERFSHEPIPHPLLFAGIFRSAYNTYLTRSRDEALKDSRQNALAMRNDCWLWGMVQERIRGVTRLKWSLEVDNPLDPYQAKVRDGLTRSIKAVPKFKRLLRKQSECVWFGRYGIAPKWRWFNSGGERLLTVGSWKPVNGDKIDWDFEGTPFVFISGSYQEQLGEDAPVITTDQSHALLLKGAWREQVLIDTHDPDDVDFFEGEMASAIHGVGIRHWIYWLWWLRDEFLSWMTESLERTGLGLVLIKYDQGNVEAETAAKALAKNYGRRTVLTVPVPAGTINSRVAGGPYGVEIVETPTAGIEILDGLRQRIEDQIERFIIAQTGSSRSDTEGMGTHDTDFMQDTKSELIAGDAEDRAETLTGSDAEPGLVSVLKRWSYPWADFPVRFRFEMDEVDPAKKLEAVNTAVSIGVAFKADEVRELTGLSKPGPADETVGGQQALAQAQAAEAGGNAPPSPTDGAGNPLGDDKDGGKPFSRNGHARRYKRESGDDGEVPFARRRQPARYTFDPDQPRADDGKWSDTGATRHKPAGQKPSRRRVKKALLKIQRVVRPQNLARVARGLLKTARHPASAAPKALATAREKLKALRERYGTAGALAIAAGYVGYYAVAAKLAPALLLAPVPVTGTLLTVAELVRKVKHKLVGAAGAPAKYGRGEELLDGLDELLACIAEEHGEDAPEFDDKVMSAVLRHLCEGADEPELFARYGDHYGFDPDEPRDEGGKWTAGGGKASQGDAPDYKDAGAVSRWLKKRLPFKVKVARRSGQLTLSADTFDDLHAHAEGLREAMGADEALTPGLKNYLTLTFTTKYKEDVERQQQGGGPPEPTKATRKRGRDDEPLLASEPIWSGEERSQRYDEAAELLKGRRSGKLDALGQALAEIYMTTRGLDEAMGKARTLKGWQSGDESREYIRDALGTLYKDAEQHARTEPPAPLPRRTVRDVERDAQGLIARVLQREQVYQYGRWVDADAAEPDRYHAQWITVGGRPNPAKGTKHEDGTPVEVEGGRITKGPPALKGKALGKAARKPKDTRDGQKPQQPAAAPAGAAGDGAGGAGTGGAPAQAGGAVASPAVGPGDAEGDRGGQAEGEPAGTAAARRVPASRDEVNRRLSRFEQFFRAKGQHQAADWMGMIRGHVEAVGTDAALASLPAEVAGEGEAVEYEGGFAGMGDFAEKYLNRHGITPTYQLDEYSGARRISAQVGTETGEAPRPGDVVSAAPHLTNKLAEAKALPGLEASEDVHVLMGREVSHLTPDVIAAMDQRYGQGQWIIKAYGAEAFAGFGIFFPQRVAQMQQDARSALWASGAELPRWGFSHLRNEAGKVVGIRHQGGRSFLFGTPEYEATIQGDARYWADQAAVAADHEQGPKLPAKDFMAQPAFRAVGVSDADRAAGRTIAPGEGRTHIVTRNGKAELVPSSTWIKGEHLPVVFETDDTRAMAQAALDAINALPPEARQGQVYAPDILKAEDGYKIVEANPSDPQTGSSGYLEDNPFIIDSYVSHLTGRAPAHVRFIRQMLTTKQRAAGPAPAPAEGSQ